MLGRAADRLRVAPAIAHDQTRRRPTRLVDRLLCRGQGVAGARCRAPSARWSGRDGPGPWHPGRGGLPGRSRRDSDARSTRLQRDAATLPGGRLRGRRADLFVGRGTPSGDRPARSSGDGSAGCWTDGSAGLDRLCWFPPVREYQGLTATKPRVYHPPALAERLATHRWEGVELHVERPLHPTRHAAHRGRRSREIRAHLEVT
jgi:hypothetical protein